LRGRATLGEAHRFFVQCWSLPFGNTFLSLQFHRSRAHQRSISRSKNVLDHFLLYQKNAILSIPIFLFSSNLFDIFTKNK
jgi:hypothetical protein